MMRWVKKVRSNWRFLSSVVEAQEILMEGLSSVAEQHIALREEIEFLRA